MTACVIYTTEKNFESVLTNLGQKLQSTQTFLTHIVFFGHKYFYKLRQTDTNQHETTKGQNVCSCPSPGLKQYRDDQQGLFLTGTTTRVDETLRNLSWPTLEQRLKSARLTMMYKITTKLSKVHSPKLQLQPQSRARRDHEHCHRQYSCRTKHRRTSFFPRTVRDRNSLPRGTVQAPHPP